MTRMSTLPIEDATGRTRILLESLVKRRGRVTNMVGVLANSAAATNAFFSFNAALAGGSLDAALRERIAIAVAEQNDCGVCLAAHTAFGMELGIGGNELSAARRGQSQDPALAAALRFATQVLSKVGDVSNAELEDVRGHGFTDAQLLEITATVFINAFTNAVNHLAATEPDYPAVQ